MCACFKFIQCDNVLDASCASMEFYGQICFLSSVQNKCLQLIERNNRNNYSNRGNVRITLIFNTHSSRIEEHTVHVRSEKGDDENDFSAVNTRWWSMCVIRMSDNVERLQFVPFHIFLLCFTRSHSVASIETETTLNFWLELACSKSELTFNSNTHYTIRDVENHKK